MSNFLESIVRLSMDNSSDNSYCMVIPRHFQKQFILNSFSSVTISLLSFIINMDMKKVD